jgi:PAS domain S-box-containing protein
MNHGAYQDALAVLERLAHAGLAPGGASRRADSATASPEPAVNDAAFPAAPSDQLVHNWSDSTLRNLLESLPDAMVVIGSHGTIVLVNAQTERIFGYQRGEMLGRPIEMLVPERFRPGHVAHRDSYFAAPRSRPMGARLELFGRRRDGTEFPVEISLSPMTTEQGVYATSVIRDISQRKRAEAKFRSLVENIPAVTFIAPLDESVPELYVSPQIEALLGFSQMEWLEDPVLWHRQLHPADRDRWNHQFAPTCAGGVPFNSIYRFIAKDGRVVWVHGSAHVVRDTEGKPSFLQGVAFDITSIKEAEEALRRSEEELRKSHAELDRRVEERTHELSRSLTELQEKSDELKQFAYRASHDLKEPLRSLVNFPQLLAKNYGDKVDDRANEWISKTIEGAKRMRRLIVDISEYEKYLRHDEKYQPTDCAAVAADAHLNLQAAIEESRAEVIVEELPAVMGNRQRLILLFQNLIGNAIKYRDPERPLRVEVGARQQLEGWLFWVRDNGIGIEARFREKIFELGERLHTQEKIPGSGFGLTICAKVVAWHGGRIWVESEPGAGSTFFFTLPAAVAVS